MGGKERGGGDEERDREGERLRERERQRLIERERESKPYTV